jgi:hypothetical protein
MIQTDLLIIGAGPVGLFTVFEAGLLKMRCHLVDALPMAGGQLTEIYPKKPIYDIPGYPSVLAGDLIDKLLEQIDAFIRKYYKNEMVKGVLLFVVIFLCSFLFITQIVLAQGGWQKIYPPILGGTLGDKLTE